MGSEIDNSTGIASVMGSTAEGGEVRCKLGYLSSGEGIDAGAAYWGPDGYISRPNEPGSGEAAQAFYLQSANRRYLLGSRDNRFAPLVGSLEPGDRMIVTDGEARLCIKQADDAVTLYTVNQDINQSMMVSLDGAGGELNLINGKAFIRLGADETGKMCLTLGISGGATISLYEDGLVQVNGASFMCATGGGCFGVITEGPPAVPPQPPIMSVLVGPTGMAGAPAARWTMVP